MSATGIGASVRRKEDQRFITGKGHYTDDINRPGQSHAYFLRSPHAHARIKSLDSKAAATMPGVLAVLAGAELAADKIGGLICGWMITSKDGSQMKNVSHPAIAGKANHVGDAVAVVCETLAQAKAPPEDQDRLRALAGGGRSTAKAQSACKSTRWRRATRSISAPWRSKAAEAAFKAAKHVTKLDLVNNRRDEPRAAIAEYDSGTDCLTPGTPRRMRTWLASSSPLSSALRPSRSCA